MVVYKGQGIDWHPQSDSLGVSSLKWTQSTPTFISGSMLSSGKPKAIDLLYWLFQNVCVAWCSEEGRLLLSSLPMVQPGQMESMLGISTVGKFCVCLWAWQIMSLEGWPRQRYTMSEVSVQVMESPFKGKDSVYMLLPRRPGVNGAQYLHQQICRYPWNHLLINGQQEGSQWWACEIHVSHKFSCA